MCRNSRLTDFERFVGDELGEAMGEESGGMSDEEGIVRVEDGAVEGVDCGEARGGVVIGRRVFVIGDGDGEKGC